MIMIRCSFCNINKVLSLTVLIRAVIYPYSILLNGYFTICNPLRIIPFNEVSWTYLMQYMVILFAFGHYVIKKYPLVALSENGLIITCPFFCKLTQHQLWLLKYKQYNGCQPSSYPFLLHKDLMLPQNQYKRLDKCQDLTWNDQLYV